MIEINGSELNQWDTGRGVVVKGVEAEYVHLANQGDSKAVIVGLVDIDAPIPDFLLQTGKSLWVYAVRDGVTLESRMFSVKKRPRPENYVYEDDQRNYIYELITDAQTATEEANHAAQVAVEIANQASQEAVGVANQAATVATQAGQNAVESAGVATQAANKANEAVEDAKKATDNANEAAGKAIRASNACMVIGKAEGESITLYDAIEQYLMGCRIFGKTTQEGVPTPEAPVELVNVGDSGSITVNVTGDNDAQSVTIATPNGLSGIPVTSGGNYTDANGQQWVCDEIDFARGVRTKRNERLVLTGGEAWYESSTNPGRFGLKSTQYIYDGGRCSHYPVKVSHPDGSIYLSYTNTILVNDSRFAGDLSGFKAWLSEQDAAGTPVVVLCLLHSDKGGRTETPLSKEELAAYAELHTYRNNTTVSNNDGAHMALEYVMDAKKYIDGLIAGSILPATVE